MASLTTASGRTMGRQISPVIVVVPTVAADLIAADSWLFQLSVTNSTAAAINLTILDKQGTPRAAFRSTIIAPNASPVFFWPEGIFLSGGINWVASAVGLEAAVTAWYKGA